MRMHKTELYWNCWNAGLDITNTVTEGHELLHEQTKNTTKTMKTKTKQKAEVGFKRRTLHVPNLISIWVDPNN